MASPLPFCLFTIDMMSPMTEKMCPNRGKRMALTMRMPKYTCGYGKRLYREGPKAAINNAARTGDKIASKKPANAFLFSFFF